ncbi:hypothetical protein SLEP1_g56540 [Rubroshorea leprosula]|uniref:Uncharacterized protein n=1 Tax=Rubroshorea leprosula TaxID=152421 RepID=A0AAV5MLD1_9ROSI|nr:hypothetical protein SLEP1_g56540 [Rubroshorea leprosula]
MNFVDLQQVHPDTRNDNFVDSGANSEKVENDVFNIPSDEQSLGVPISSINLDNQDDVGSGPKAVQNIKEIRTTAPSLGNTSEGLQAGKGMNDDDFGLSYESQEFGGHPEMQEKYQLPMDLKLHSDSTNKQTIKFYGYLNMEEKSIYPPAIRQHLLDGSLTEGLEIDSFISGMSEMSEEIGDVTELDESHMQYCAGLNRETVWNRNGIAGYLADRSLDVHIPSINLDHHDDAAGRKAVQKISEISAAPLGLGNAPDCRSRKDL